MLFPTEVQKLHEYIKDYYRFAKFNDTLECFDAEINAKIISKKLEDMDIDFLSEGSPELFKLMKGTSSQSLETQKRLRQMEAINDKYLDLLAGSRQIYGLAVKLLGLCEENKTVGCDNLVVKRQGRKDVAT